MSLPKEDNKWGGGKWESQPIYIVVEGQAVY